MRSGILSGIIGRIDAPRWVWRDRVESGPVRLGRRRIYILPTRSGMTFALVLLAMLIGAMNYGNSLAYALTFLLAGMGMVTMVHTFRGLHGLLIRGGHCRAVFAGEDAVFPLRVENPGGQIRRALAIGLEGGSQRIVDIDQEGASWIELHCRTAHRGRPSAPTCVVHTRYPLGLFRAWSRVRLAMDCIVYPRPATEGALPDALLHGHGSRGDRGRGADDFAGLRDYTPGDSLRHVYWAGLARGEGLLTKQFGGDTSDEIWLRWTEVPVREVEARLERLCRWVLEADELGLAYGLELPDARIRPGRGDTHRRRCLEALALYGADGGQQ